MNVALVYDRVTKWGGAERVLLALHELWPDAPLYTAVYDKKNASWADVFVVRPSFLQYMPFAKQAHELFAWLTPMAFEAFSFDAYDLVISVTSAEAKNIITKPGTLHVCYCLTPTRYLWSAQALYEEAGFAGSVLKILAPTLKRWDRVAAARPDYYIAISDTVKKRITRYYERPVERVVYPPVDVGRFKHVPAEDYFLCVSRMVKYKRLDVIISAFNQLGWPLVMIGDGREKARLMRMAKKNIRFLGQVSEQELASYYERCHVFVCAADEDFGIAGAEAQAAGKPVVAFGKGGMAEIVVPGKTGELFSEQTVPSLVAALKKMRNQWYDSASCKKNATRFSTEVFRQNMKDAIMTLYNKKTV